MSRRIGKRIALVLAAALVIICAALLLIPVLGGGWIEQYAIAKIREVGRGKFRSTVTVESVRIRLLPPGATMTGVEFRHKDRTDVPPLFRIRQLDVSGGFRVFAFSPYVSTLRLTGLEIVVPRRKGPKSPSSQKATSSEPERKSGSKVRDVNFFVSEIIADGAILQVLSKKEGREPLRFDLQFLRLHDVSLDQPMKYVTRLTNPRPPGLVRSTGKFGPWDAEDPSMTPLEGEFLFTDADLSDFKGISGILKSEGKFKGVLEEFTVDGAAEVPDFRLNISGNPIHLKTSYHAIVDGTNGDTRLEPVRAEFLSSKVVARGAVEGEKGKKGKGVRLDVDVSRARIEDLLKLSTRGNNPLLTGPIRFQTKFYLPPGKEDVVQKLTLDGRFRIDKGEFRKNSLQEKIDSLSRKGQGKPGDTAVHHVPSDLQAQFQLAKGMIRFQDLLFRVAGAGVNLDGYYGLENEELDFQGRLELDAKISQTTTGFKSLILRPIDPLFSRKGHGSVLPITIKGTRSKPEFGIDLGKTIRRSR